MQIQVLPGRRLSPEHQEAWRSILHSVSQFDSPYFRPEFTQMVAKVRPKVEVAVLTHCGEHIGFFPFERKAAYTAEPVAGALSDFHGVIALPSLEWSAAELLEASGLEVWDFSHLLVAGDEFQAGYWRRNNALSMDLTQGFEAYRIARQQAGSKHTKQTFQRKRKLERELGPVTVDSDCRAERVFQELWQWKSQQYRKSGLKDLLAIPWIKELLRAIWQESNSSFRGRLFALYANGELLAAEFTMQSGSVLHSWFPAYNRRFAKYGAGHILRLEMARAADELGIQRIDLGRDQEPFKLSLASKAVSIAGGSFDLNPLRSVVRKVGHQAFTWFRSVCIGDKLLNPCRVARKVMRLALTSRKSIQFSSR